MNAGGLTLARIWSSSTCVDPCPIHRASGVAARARLGRALGGDHLRRALHCVVGRGRVDPECRRYVQMKAGHSQLQITERYIHAAQVLFPGAAAKGEARMFALTETPRDA